jgi:hypothetical protein
LGKGLITDEIAKGLKRRTIFSTWDKTKMYPGFYKNHSKIKLLNILHKL